MKFFKTFESFSSNKFIICVDIQPEYEKGISKNFDIYDWLDYLKNEFENGAEVLFLYNGHENFNEAVDEDQYKEWMLEKTNYDESFNDLIYGANYFDKMYAFLRPLSELLDFDDVVDILKEMRSKKLSNSDELDEETVQKFREKYGSGFDQGYENGFWIPLHLKLELQDITKPIEIMGGNLEECLKEIEILLEVFGKKVETNQQFVY